MKRGPQQRGQTQWIVRDSTHIGGKPRIKGTRISLVFLLDMLSQGMTVDEIVTDYPSLDKRSVLGALQELKESFDGKTGRIPQLAGR